MPTFALAGTPPKTATAVDRPVFRDELDDLPSGIAKAAKLQGFHGKVGQTMPMVDPDGGLEILVGMGTTAKLSYENVRLAAAGYARCVHAHQAVACGLVEAVSGRTLASGEKAEPRLVLNAAMEGLGLASYRFTEYKAKQPVKLRKVTLVSSDKGLRPALKETKVILDAVELARDLVNEPGGSLLPVDFTARAKKVAAASGLTATVWNEARIRKEKLGGVLAVSKGSSNAPQFLTLKYEPRGAKGHVALVGKGVTFDSGGLSLKTGTGMMVMKIDMAGAATVMAAMTALKELKVPVAVTGFIPLVENMPSGDALRPGDVFAARNNKTVEVLNTDAEGRLILADALCLASESGADAIIDIATLTGSATVALGSSYAALMANDDPLAARIEAAAAKVSERLWRLPLPPEYRSQLDSSVADLRNIGTGPHGGALVAGLFLQEFVDDRPWAHIDLGISAITESNKGTQVKGATALGVRTLIEVLRHWDDA